MNDIILSAVLNLFALFGSKRNLDRDKSLEIIIYYLKRFYTVLDRKSYIDFYTDLRDFYDEFPVDDPSVNVRTICSKLHSSIESDDQALMLLRFMEFSTMGGEKLEGDDPIIRAVADSFAIDDELFNDFLHFVNEEVGDKVKIMTLGEEFGHIRTLYLKDRSNTLIYSYLGQKAATMFDSPVDRFFHLWPQSGVLKIEDHSPIYYSMALSNYDSKTAGSSVVLCADNVDFRFKKGGNGLHNFSSRLEGGQLVAIMGGSGVGKSTLMSILTGDLIPQQGSVTLNGHPVSDFETKSAIGFVPQDDMVIEELTVYQNLWYTAKLCFDGLDDAGLDAKVMDVLCQLELDMAKDLKVGSPINKFISGGQRKRLNIAMELIRQPSVIFLDEPTSGLSSADTEKVITILKMLTFQGKLIIANIHQPSSDVYKMFDRLLLLDTGGYPIYDGNPIDAISYFKTAENFADASISACKTCGTVRPELILNIISTKKLDATGRMTEQRKTTAEMWHQRYIESRPEVRTPSSKELPETGQSRPSAIKQTAIYIRRNISTKLANMQYIMVTLLEAPLLAVICALLTHFISDSGTYTVMDNKNMVIYYFMAVIVAVFMGMSGSAEEIIRDRILLKREKFLNLSYGSYISSKILFMAAVSLVQTLLFILIGNLIAGIHGLFLVWWMVLFLSSFLSGLIGLLLSQCLSSVVAIYITIPLLLIPQILLCGLVVDFDDLNPGSETGNAPVIGDIIPSRWAYEALAVANFSMNPYEKDYFEAERDKYECIYFENAYLYELRSQLETYEAEKKDGGTADPHHIDVIRTALPKLTAVCGMEEYNGDFGYESLSEYFDNAKKILSKRSNRVTLAIDREISLKIKEMGRDGFLQFKRDNYNSRLEDLVVNRNAEKLCVVRGTHIVPRTGFIFLTPDSRAGRAPFYSGVKRLGNTLIPTIWFNMAVMVLMCLILSVFLYTDFPGQRIRSRSK